MASLIVPNFTLNDWCLKTFHVTATQVGTPALFPVLESSGRQDEKPLVL